LSNSSIALDWPISRVCVNTGIDGAGEPRATLGRLLAKALPFAPWLITLVNIIFFLGYNFERYSHARPELPSRRLATQRWRGSGLTNDTPATLSEAVSLLQMPRNVRCDLSRSLKVEQNGRCAYIPSQSYS
jgi:hypothetical protein